jgi:UDP-N-acetylglucosamine acyltransferase
MSKIHPTAIVSREATLADDVTVGAYSIIKGAVDVGAGTVIEEHCHIHGQTRIGQDCRIGPTAFVGLAPQHTRADPNAGQLIVGDRVIMREMVSVHRSITAGPEHATRIGSDCFLMGATHVGHDSILGTGVIMANGAAMGGHCQIGDRAFIGGAVAIHQFVRIGRLALIGANETVTQEVPPFAAMRFGGLKGYNAVGCRRADLSQQSLHAIRAAFRCLRKNRLVTHAVQEIQQTVVCIPEIEELLAFIHTTKRGMIPAVNRRAPQRDEIDA